MSPESESFQIPQAVPSSEDADSFKLKYEERKALIKTPDEELVEFGKKESHGFKNPTEHISASDFFAGADVLEEHLEGKRLIDLGAGESGLWRGLGFISSEGHKDGHDFGISEFIAVDLFVDSSVAMKNVEGKLKRLDPSVREVAQKKLTFEQKDIFTYLLEQPDNSGNVRISSIDYALIPSAEYLARVAQEIFRVVPEDGLLSIINCSDIADEAKHLFPYSVKLKFGSEILSKKEVCPQIVADTGTFQFYQYLLEASRNGFLEMNEEIIESMFNKDKKRGGLAFDGTPADYFVECGFIIDVEEFYKAREAFWEEGSGRFSILKR